MLLDEITFIIFLIISSQTVTEEFAKHLHTILMKYQMTYITNVLDEIIFYNHNYIPRLSLKLFAI